MEARIVIIDNDESMRALVTASLKEKGWQAFDSDYAHIDLAAVARYRPHLMILDFDFENVGMVWEFLQLVKMDDTTAHIPIIITTVVFLLPLEIKNYLLTRHISVVHKSYDLDVFIALIEKTLAEANQSGVISFGDRRLPILLVEDTDDLRDSFSMVLRLEGFSVITAENGAVALDALSGNACCLILLDLNMPIMNGYEFLKAYGQQIGSHTPVVILSAEEDNDFAFPAFVMSRLQKPFLLEKLLTVVSHYADPV